VLSLYILNIIGGRSRVGKLLCVFIVAFLPCAITYLCYTFRWEMGDTLPSIAISSFSIFSAMLFASQVAAFSVFNYKISEIKPKNNPDDIVRKTREMNFSVRSEELRGAFRRINAGISVLTLISIFIVAATLGVVAEPPPEMSRVLTAAVCLFATHFFMSFIITCHQVFLFFDTAYAGESV